MAEAKKAPATPEEEEVPNLNLLHITDGETERGIPLAKFIDDVDEFSTSFQPPASAELLIGAYSDMMGRYRVYESKLAQKQFKYSEKIPELEKSLTLVRTLAQKKQAAQDGEGEATGVVRYSLAENIFANADLDFTTGTVHLWLGANVMLEFTYSEALEFLGQQHAKAVQESNDTTEDTATIRDQIVTCEVSISRIFNWSVRKKRAAEGGSKP
uniref:Prefoldin subunit 3 n=1 Tax=Amphora coffeiformis TaxID=265554 RepID=A0A7S3P7U6_9STRA